MFYRKIAAALNFTVGECRARGNGASIKQLYRTWSRYNDILSVFEQKRGLKCGGRAVTKTDVCAAAGMKATRESNYKFLHRIRLNSAAHDWLMDEPNAIYPFEPYPPPTTLADLDSVFDRVFTPKALAAPIHVGPSSIAIPGPAGKKTLGDYFGKRKEDTSDSEKEARRRRKRKEKRRKKEGDKGKGKAEDDRPRKKQKKEYSYVE